MYRGIERAWRTGLKLREDPQNVFRVLNPQRFSARGFIPDHYASARCDAVDGDCSAARVSGYLLRDEWVLVVSPAILWTHL
jgi:hypothetical protein